MKLVILWCLQLYVVGRYQMYALGCMLKLYIYKIMSIMSLIRSLLNMIEYFSISQLFEKTLRQNSF